MGFFEKLKQGLSKTKNSFDEKINNVFSNFRTSWICFIMIMV